MTLEKRTILGKTILHNLSAENIVYMSSRLMVNLGNTFRKCLKKGAKWREGAYLIFRLKNRGGIIEGGLNRGNMVTLLHLTFQAQSWHKAGLFELLKLHLHG